GQADYAADIPMRGLLHGAICRATIAHGAFLALDVSEAAKVPGVLKILTPADLPKALFSTAGHPYVLDGGGDIYDRNILTDRVRFYGDEIAAVVAETPLAAKTAAEKIVATYREFPFYLTPEEAKAEGAAEIHEGRKGNVLARTSAAVGDVEKGFAESDLVLEAEYRTQVVQHCHMENQVAVAFRGPDLRWVCVSSTQIPHICRRILGEAFDMPWGNFRVIKPFVGGGFGNKQDVVVEPLAVAMSMAVGGRPVRLALTREEVLAHTRVRHAITYKSRIGLKRDGTIVAWQMDAVSQTGGYASHGHSVAGKGAGILATAYRIPNMLYRAETVYTNTGNAGAMRGYGVPQIVFAIEAQVERAAAALGMDGIEFRRRNFNKEGIPHPLNGIPMATNRIADCLERGLKAFDWDAKKARALASRTEAAGPLRRGVGLAAFVYTTSVYPYSLEIAGCRLALNQDGSVKMLVGATEIGQGSDTALAQIAAETLGISPERIIADERTDTDIAPFDTGAYASRQTYVSGMAVRKAALQLKEKILHVAESFYGIEAGKLDLDRDAVIDALSGERVAPLADLALRSFYDMKKAGTLVAEVSHRCESNSYPSGVSFAEVEADTETGTVRLVGMLNAHDSGVIVNPLLARGQVEGGMGMGIGYALYEELLYDRATGAPLNDNLLDYKMPTFMDIPELETLFVEPVDPHGPFGAKGLGEPPICSPAAAIRNAVCDALGIQIDFLPLTPGRVFEAIRANEAIGGGKGDV
ncbi:MAG: xanthine dehydrogenase molybdenum-binding subunit XdhA, partial [Treponema sp.]|nr:xanthine dehydrogenase molybdenum-binding subunit XdhA [Treponema sp.]